jgi:D-tyrosyl-tRNA(Tyr) deacylase
MVGIARKDKEEDIYRMAEKIIKLRLFENEENKFDKELKDVNGEILVISQFTLFADCSKGKRPYFGQAEEPARANELYERFIRKLKTIYNASKVKSGKFGAKMLVEIANDGPVTIILDSTAK